MRMHEKIAIGAMGGLALVLLKLIEVRFLVNEPSTATILAAYLTYGAYIALGVLVAVFFTDDSLEPTKRRKNAFVSGLLAPSVLLAVVNQGHAPRGDAEPPVIPKIAGMLISSAHAQAPRAPAPQVTNLRRQDLGSDFSDGVKIATGQYPTSVYVLGEAKDQARATEYAAKVNGVLGAPAGARGQPSANVVHIIDENRWLVTVGKPGNRTQLEGVRANVNQKAIQVINGTAAREQKDVAASILQGKVVNESDLASR